MFFMCPTSWTFKHGGPKYFQTRGCLVSRLPSAMCYIRERATSVDVLRSLKFVSLFALCCFGQQASEVFLWAWMLRADFQYSRHFTLVQGKQVKLTRTDGSLWQWTIMQKRMGPSKWNWAISSIPVPSFGTRPVVCYGKGLLWVQC